MRIIIIGAGPAGSLAALLLARHGLQVTLIEQHRFPRDKVCGECISALGVQALRRAGLANELGDAVPLRHCLLHAPDGSTARLRLPAPMLGLSRFRLDTMLLDAAIRAGARILQPARCESVAALDKPVVRIRSLLDNAVEELVCDHVLLCDGKSALLPDRPRPTADIGLKAHFQSITAPPEAIHLFGLKGHYVGLAPVEGNRWNLCMSVPSAKLARHRSPSLLFQRLLMESPQLAASLSRARQMTPWLAAPLPRFPVRHDTPANILPLGNAAAALEPIGGEGIGLALRSAEIAIGGILDGETVPIQSRFQSLWRTRRLACRCAALWISHPLLCNLGTRLLNELPALGEVLLPWLGKAGPAGPSHEPADCPSARTALPLAYVHDVSDCS